MHIQRLFSQLYHASTETEVERIFTEYPVLQATENWKPYGQNESNFGVVENQQASPIPALVEKIINSIDAILMRRCLEEGIDPRSSAAPRTMEEAINRFFPNAKQWDLAEFRRKQADAIQVIADGPKRDTSLVIYDDGEGQRPEDFEDTFLSLLRGNKNEIHFVQGKYNMGGAGAIAFCGKNRYQLIGSKRFDGSGEFGFTLIRRHPLTAAERAIKKNTWYEYLVLDGRVPSFPTTEMDLGLYNRKFKSGTVIKLYSYDLPSGIAVISRDLNQSINEYLFSPALPLYTIEKPERYPKDRAPERHLYGLKRRLEEEGSKYVEQFFSDDLVDKRMGRIKVTCYLFRPKIDGRTAKESKETIQREFFKNNMAVLFSVHGQVHGHYTSEFITRSLKFPLLKDYLLIHADCTEVKLEFRNELFMASRDRVKDGEESRALRRRLADLLANGRLKKIHKARKASITVESKDTEDLLRSFTRNLPLEHELMQLLNQTFKLEERTDGGARAKKHKERTTRKREEELAFQPKRFPSFFKLDVRSDGDTPMIKVPRGGDRTIKFFSDVEDQYFDRVNEPGNLKIAILDVKQNETTGGTKPGLPDRPIDLLNVVKSSPHRGTIRVTLNPTEELRVGDSVKMEAELTGAGSTFQEIFLVKITDPEKKRPKKDPGTQEPENRIGLPELTLAYKDEGKGPITWDRLEQQGIEIDHAVVMYPLVEGEVLSRIYVNMDSSVLLNYRSKLSGEEAIALAERRYISAVYFHTLFLYMITRNRKYEIVRHRDGNESDEPVDLTEYLKDLFQSYYAEFLLNFEVQDLIAALE